MVPLEVVPKNWDEYSTVINKDMKYIRLSPQSVETNQNHF